MNNLQLAWKTVLVLLLLLVCSCNKQSEQQVWRFAIEEVKGSVQYAYAQKFKELIEERSQGKIKVIVYPYGTLGTSDQLLQLVHTNTLQFAMASPGHLGKTIEELQLFSLHFLFSENEEVNKEVLGKGRTINEGLAELYSEKGFQLLAFYPEGWQVWTSNQPLKRPEHFQGFKMRVMTTPVLLRSYEAYGASAVPLPYSEVYSALQLNMIDGQVNPVFAIEEMSFYEVCDYMIFPKASLFITSAISNQKFFKQLSEENKKMVLRTIAELQDYIFEVQKKLNKRRLAQIKHEKPEINIIHLDEKQRARFEKESLKVREWYAQMAGERGKKILESLLQEIEETEQKFESSASTSSAKNPN